MSFSNLFAFPLLYRSIVILSKDYATLTSVSCELTAVDKDRLELPRPEGTDFTDRDATNYVLLIQISVFPECHLLYPYNTLLDQSQIKPL